MKAYVPSVKTQRYGFSIKTEVGGERLGFINLMKARKDYDDLQESFMDLLMNGKIREKIGVVSFRDEPVIVLYLAGDKHPVGWIYSHIECDELLALIEDAEVFRWDYAEGEESAAPVETEEVPF